MKQTLLFLSLLIFSLCKVHGVDPYFACGGSDWFTYKDEKCLKFINKLVTYDEAEKICNQENLQNNSIIQTLVTIKSAVEQEYLTKYIFDLSGAMNNVWIGAKRRTINDNQFVWNDGSNLDFTNWDVGNPFEDTESGCVLMQSEFTRQFCNISNFDKSAINGKWANVPCNKRNLVLCQKLQIWSPPKLQKKFLGLIKELRDTRDELDNTKNKLEGLQKNQEETHEQINAMKERKLSERITSLEKRVIEKNDLNSMVLEVMMKLTEKLEQNMNDLKQETHQQINDLKQETHQQLNDFKQETHQQINAMKEMKLNERISSLEKTEHKMKDVLENRGSLILIPIGFIYIQFPLEPEPKYLYPGVVWTEISAKYAGLFFRVLGGNSAPFGETQAENAPRLVHVNSTPVQFKPINYSHDVGVTANNTLSSIIYSGANNGGDQWGLRFKASSGEVRPRNQAIRIWQRTQ